MKSMILDWYYSVVLPELKADLDDEEYRKAEQERGKLLDALMDTLNKQQKEQLLAYEEACNWADDFPMEYTFVQGFRLGARLMIEVLDTGGQRTPTDPQSLIPDFCPPTASAEK